MKRITTAIKHLNFKHLAAALPFFLSLQLFAATTYTSAVSTGNWSNPSSWTVSGTGTPIIYRIQTGHTITLDSNAINIDTLYINGTLSMGSNVLLRMTASGAIFFNSTGEMNSGSNNSEIHYGTSSSVKIIGPFTAARTIDNGPRYGNINTMIAANGDPQGSFPIPLPLPVKDVQVSNTGEVYSISWTAMGDENKKDFLITSSTNGITFNHVAILPGKTTAGEAYYSYELGRISNSSYIRVSSFTHEDTNELVMKFIEIGNSSNPSFSFNPTVMNSTAASVQLSLPSSGTYSFVVYDYNMKQVAETSFSTQTDNEEVSIRPFVIPVRSGVYIAMISHNSGHTYQQKFVVNQD